MLIGDLPLVPLRQNADLTGSKRLSMGYAWAITIAIAIAIVSVVGALHPNLVTPLAIVILAMVGMLVFVPCGTAPTDRVPRNAQLVDENDPLVVRRLA